MKQPSVSLRERKKQRTRDAIIQAAELLFSERGFDKTTVEQIAAAADVSRRTFFRYFPSKEMVMFPHQDIYLARFRNLLAQGDDNESPVAALRRACLAMANAYMQSREEHLKQQRIIQASRTLIARGNELDAIWEQTIAEELIRRLGSTRTAQRRARLVAGAMLGAIRAALQEWYASECREDIVDIGKEALAILAFGLDGRLNDETPGRRPVSSGRPDAAKDRATN
jgi:AcrR family transcriptional regulator